MEDFSRPPAEEPEASPAESPKPPSWRESFFLSWLRRRQESERPDSPEANDDDEDDEETDKASPGTRFLSRWKKLFAGLVSKPDGSEPKQEPRDRIPDREAWSPEQPVSSPAETDEAVEHIEPAETIAPEPSVDAVEPDRPLPAPEEDQAVPVAVEAANETGQPAEPDVEPAVADPEPAEAFFVPEAARVAAAAETAPEPVEERIIERRGGTGPAIAAFVGAEFLSRRRDRKIRREVERLKKETERAAETNQTLRDKLESRINRVKERLVTTEKQNENTSPVEPAVEKVIESPVKTPAAEVIAKPKPVEAAPAAETRPASIEMQTDTTPEKQAETPSPPEVAPPLPETTIEQIIQRMPEVKPVLENEHDLKPETILHKVEEAADKAVPIERLFERRHEVKDEATQPAHSLTGVAATCGVNIVNSGLSLAQSSSSGGHTPPPAIPVSPQPLPQTSSNMYKQAVTSGFITGVVILAIVTAMALFN